MYINSTKISTRGKVAIAVYLTAGLLVAMNCTKHNDPIISEPAITLVEMSDCNFYSVAKPIIDTTFDFDCIEYSYQPAGVLTLRHINAGFNCCPEIDIDIEIEGDTIIIRENELLAGCACDCLYNLDLEARGLPPGEYWIRVIEPYVWPDDEQLAFTVNLASEPSGTFCVPRDRYPWGTYDYPY